MSFVTPGTWWWAFLWTPTPLVTPSRRRVWLLWGTHPSLSTTFLSILSLMSICLPSISVYHLPSSPEPQFSSVTQSCLTLWPHGLQHARVPCPSPPPAACSNSCPLSLWCHPTISSSVVPFSSCLQSFPASGSFQMSQFFTSGGQSIRVSASASVLPVNIQDWFPLGWTGWISLQTKGLSKVFSNTTVQKHQFFGSQLSI